MKNRARLWYALGAIALLAILYVGFDTKPSGQRTLEKSRALSQKQDIASIRAEAIKTLRKDELDYLETLEAQFHHAGSDSVKAGLLKQLSGYWFSLQDPLMAGFYAAEVAEKENTASSWAIAGTTFASSLSGKESDASRLGLLKEQALMAFEKAISLEPDAVDHRVNQALCFIEAPDEGQPMKGIQMLAGLVEAFPQSPAPPYHLARLAVQTGQYERARTRIDQALLLDSADARIMCLAADIYTALEQRETAETYSARCAEMKKK